MVHVHKFTLFTFKLFFGMISIGPYLLNTRQPSIPKMLVASKVQYYIS